MPNIDLYGQLNEWGLRVGRGARRCGGQGTTRKAPQTEWGGREDEKTVKKAVTRRGQGLGTRRAGPHSGVAGRHRRSAARIGTDRTKGQPDVKRAGEVRLVGGARDSSAMWYSRAAVWSLMHHTVG